MKLFTCLGIFFGVVVCFLVTISLVMKSTITCNPNYISGETECQKGPPGEFFFKGKLFESKRSGYGVFKTSSYEYKGQYDTDMRNGFGEVKILSGYWDPYTTILKGKWLDNELYEKADLQMFFNSSLRMTFKGQVSHSKMDGVGEISCFQDDNLFFKITRARFSEGLFSLYSRKENPRKKSMMEIFLVEGGSSIELEIEEFKSEFGIRKGYQSAAKITQKLGTVKVEYGWNGKKLELISPKQDENKKPEDIIGESGNADFMIYMTEYPLTKSLVLLREFEMNFLLKELDLRNTKFDFFEMINSRGDIEDIRKHEESKENRNNDGFISS